MWNGGIKYDRNKAGGGMERRKRIEGMAVPSALAIMRQCKSSLD
jgi:hypothetical protein